MKPKHQVVLLYCQKLCLQEEEVLLLRKMKSFLVYYKNHVTSDLERDIKCKNIYGHFFKLLCHYTNITAAIEQLVVQQCSPPSGDQYSVTSDPASIQVSTKSYRIVRIISPWAISLTSALNRGVGL